MSVYCARRDDRQNIHRKETTRWWSRFVWLSSMYEKRKQPFGFRIFCHHGWFTRRHNRPIITRRTRAKVGWHITDESNCIEWLAFVAWYPIYFLPYNAWLSTLFFSPPCTQCEIVFPLCCPQLRNFAWIFSMFFFLSFPYIIGKHFISFFSTIFWFICMVSAEWLKHIETWPRNRKNI